MPKVQTHYLEHAEAQAFFELSLTDKGLRVRRGTIGQVAFVYHFTWPNQDAAKAQFERLRKVWKDGGFVRVQPGAELVEGSVAREFWSDEIEDHERYGDLFTLGIAQEWLGQRKRVLVFEHGLQCEGDFDVSEVADMRLSAALIVDGDVRVGGVFSQLAYTYPASILITGSVFADSLGHKDSFMRIQGDVCVANTVYGEYNDGSLQIDGDVYGKAWICADHDMGCSGRRHLPSFSSHDAEENWGDLSPKLTDLSGGLSWDAVRECMFARKSPLRKGFVWQPPATSEAPHAPSAQTPRESAMDQALLDSVRALAGQDDAQGIAELLAAWPEHSQQWLDMVQMRLVAPGSTEAQRQLLRQAAHVDELADSAVVQIETFAQALAPVKKLVEAMRGASGAQRVLKLLKVPPEPAVMASHSHLLLINALLKNKEFDGAYMGVLERLIELGADPCLRDPHGQALVDDSLVRSQPEVLAMLTRVLPAASIWSPPEAMSAQAAQVGDRAHAHAHVLRLLALIDAPANRMPWLALHAELVSVPNGPLTSDTLKVLLQQHGWLLLCALVRRCAQGVDDFTGSVISLLGLGCDPHAAPSGQPSAHELARSLGQTDLITCFDQLGPAPPAAPEPPDSLEVVKRLLELQAASDTNWHDPALRAWLNSVTEVKLVFAQLPRLPERLAELSELHTLQLVWCELEDFSLPDLSSLQKLRKLSLVDMRLREVPAWLEHLSEVTDLNLASNPIATLPAWLLARRNWVELSLAATALKRLPDLSAWQELKEIYLHETPLECLPAGVMDLAQLQVFHLGEDLYKSWSQSDLQCIAALRAKGVRVSSADAPEDDEDDDVAADGEQDTAQESALGEEAAPAVPKLAGASAALKAVKLLNGKAQRAQSKSEKNPEQANDLVAQALALFDKALAKARPFVDAGDEDFDYDHVFALQGQLWCVNHAAQHQAHLIGRVVALAQALLQRADTVNAMYYSELGALTRSAQVLAHNALAHWLSETGDFSQALSHAQASVEELDYAQPEATWAVVLQNQVEIQLALGRSDDAYATVFKVVREFAPDRAAAAKHSKASRHAAAQLTVDPFAYFHDLARTPEYAAWDAAN